MLNEQININDMNQIFGLKPRKGDLKKLEIIEAAIECISTIGYEKTTYDAIGRKIGTNRAHVNYYFQSKPEIFRTTIQYIYSYYKNLLSLQLEKAKSPLEELLKYIETPFIWAKKKPEQMSVMLMFYYLCVVDKSYKEINTQIRNAGVERIVLILKSISNDELNEEDYFSCAKSIQNLISGAIIDSTTTKTKALNKAMDEVKSEVTGLLKLRKIL